MANLAERIRQTGRDAMKDAQEFREACDRFAALLEGGASTLVETAKEAATIISGSPPVGAQAGNRVNPVDLKDVDNSFPIPTVRRPDGGPRR